MKLILVLLISLIFVNGCIDDSEAEELEEIDTLSKWIILENTETGGSQLLNTDEVKYIKLGGWSSSSQICTAGIYMTDGALFGNYPIGTAATSTECYPILADWNLQVMPTARTVMYNDY